MLQIEYRYISESKPVTMLNLERKAIGAIIKVAIVWR